VITISNAGAADAQGLEIAPLNCNADSIAELDRALRGDGLEDAFDMTEKAPSMSQRSGGLLGPPTVDDRLNERRGCGGTIG
jgi:hypothetical protein